LWIVFFGGHQHANTPHSAWLLRAYLKWRGRQSGSNERNEIAPSHFPHQGQNYAQWERLQQAFTAGGMGFDRHFAWQQSLGPNVRFGSVADVPTIPSNVRFTAKSGHG
jgi:hypothetical protein